MNNKIPKGYKKTDIGIIPEDWEVKRLGDDFVIQGGPFGSSIKSEFLGKRGIPIYSSINVISGDFTPKYFLDKKYYKNLKQFTIKKGDLLLTTRGTVGIAKIFANKLKTGIIHSNLTIIRPSKQIDLKYLEYIFSFPVIKKQIESLFAQTTINALYSSHIKSFLIPLPPLPEQKAIARILSDIDELIENISLLIEKKKLIKKGVMQQLLTGKKRLPGFKSKWVKKRLGEVVYFLKGKGLSKEKLSPKGKYECILYGELFTTYKEIIKEIKSKTNYKEGIPSVKGDILIPASTTTTGIDLAKASAIIKNDVLLGGDINILRKKTTELDSIFLAYYLNEDKKQEIAEKTAGITIYHLHGKDLIDIEIFYPPTLAEQKAIAQVLSDMDAEIEALERKKQKYEMIKKGMMELLLTGKVRVREENGKIKRIGGIGAIK